MGDKKKTNFIVQIVNIRCNPERKPFSKLPQEKKQKKKRYFFFQNAA